MQYTIAGSLCGRQRLQLVGLCMLTEIEKLLLMCAVRTRQLGGMHAVSVASHYGRAPCAWLTPESMLQWCRLRDPHAGAALLPTVDWLSPGPQITPLLCCHLSAHAAGTSRAWQPTWMVVDRNIMSCPIVPTLGIYSRMILQAAARRITEPAYLQHWPTT